MIFDSLEFTLRRIFLNESHFQRPDIIIYTSVLRGYTAEFLVEVRESIE